jgi:hypothetical protein
MKYIMLIIGAALASLQTVRAQDPLQAEIDALKRRVGELEDAQAAHLEGVSGRALVQAYSARSFDFGGHLTSLFAWIRGESGSATGHVASLVELSMKARIDDHWSVFATPGFYTFNGGLIDDPATPATPGDPAFTPDDDSQRVFLSRLVTEWKSSDALLLRGGVVGSPHGVTNREYFLPSRIIGQANLHTRHFLINSLYPQLFQGVAATGKCSIGRDWVEYDAYFGVDPDLPSDGLGGARLGYHFSELGLTVAVDYGRGTRPDDDDASTNFGYLQAPFAGMFNVGRDYQFGGIDFDLRKGSLLARAELYYSAERGFEDQRAASFEGSWFFLPEWSVSYRFDWYERGEDFDVFAAGVVDLGTSTEHVVGLSFNPDESIRLRLDWHHNNLPASDDVVDYVNFSWSVSF